MTIYKGDPTSAQIPAELDWLVGVLTRERVTSFLEIGSRYGHTFWNVATRVPTIKRMVSVDLPNSLGGRKDGRKTLEKCIAEINGRGILADVIFGDSTNRKIIEQVRKHFPFDAVMIDGNHSLSYVESDWANYSPQASLAIFHDISWKANGRRAKIDVPAFWERTKKDFYYEEVRYSVSDCGIGIIWKGLENARR